MELRVVLGLASHKHRPKMLGRLTGRGGFFGRYVERSMASERPRWSSILQVSVASRRWMSAASGAPPLTSSTGVTASVGATDGRGAAPPPPVAAVTPATFDNDVLQSRIAVVLCFHLAHAVGLAYVHAVAGVVANSNESVLGSDDPSDPSASSSSPSTNAGAETHHRWVKMCSVNVDRYPNLAAVFSVARGTLPVTFFVDHGTIIDRVEGPIPIERIKDVLHRFRQHWCQNTLGVNWVTATPLSTASKSGSPTGRSDKPTTSPHSSASADDQTRTKRPAATEVDDATAPVSSSSAMDRTAVPCDLHSSRAARRQRLMQLQGALLQGASDILVKVDKKVGDSVLMAVVELTPATKENIVALRDALRVANADLRSINDRLSQRRRAASDPTVQRRYYQSVAFADAVHAAALRLLLVLRPCIASSKHTAAPTADATIAAILERFICIEKLFDSAPDTAAEARDASQEASNCSPQLPTFVVDADDGVLSPAVRKLCDMHRSLLLAQQQPPQSTAAGGSAASGEDLLLSPDEPQRTKHVTRCVRLGEAMWLVFHARVVAASSPVEVPWTGEVLLLMRDLLTKVFDYEAQFAAPGYALTDVAAFIEKLKANRRASLLALKLRRADAPRESAPSLQAEDTAQATVFNAAGRLLILALSDASSTIVTPSKTGSEGMPRRTGVAPVEEVSELLRRVSSLMQQ